MTMEKSFLKWAPEYLTELFTITESIGKNILSGFIECGMQYQREVSCL